jgi:hypothetical protein
MNRKNTRAQGAPADNSGATDGGRIAFKISEVAKMSGVRPITIRRHIAKGLFAPIRTVSDPADPRDPSGSVAGVRERSGQMIAPARSIKREEDRLRQIAAANGDRIVKSRIDGSYQLVDAATNTLIWPTHVGSTRIGATFEELRERILGVTI